MPPPSEALAAAPEAGREAVATPEQLDVVDRALESGTFEAVETVLNSERKEAVDFISGFSQAANDQEMPEFAAQAGAEAQVAESEIAAATQQASAEIGRVYGVLPAGEPIKPMPVVSVGEAAPAAEAPNVVRETPQEYAERVKAIPGKATDEEMRTFEALRAKRAGEAKQGEDLERTFFGESLEEYQAALERGEIPGHEAPKTDVERWARESHVLDRYVADLAPRLALMDEETRKRYLPFYELAREQSLLNGLRSNLAQASELGWDEATKAKWEAAAEAQAEQVKKLQEQHPNVRLEEILTTGAAALAVVEEGERRKEDREAQEAHPELVRLREEAGELTAALKKAERDGDAEAYESAVKKLIEVKRNLANQLRGLPNPTAAEQNELKRLDVEIVRHEKHGEVRVEEREIAELEERKKKLEERVKELETSGPPEELAKAKQELADVVAKINAKKSHVAELRGVEAKYSDLLESYGGETSYGGTGGREALHLPDKLASVVDGISKGIHDPWSILSAVVDQAIGEPKKNTRY